MHGTTIMLWTKHRRFHVIIWKMDLLHNARVSYNHNNHLHNVQGHMIYMVSVAYIPDTIILSPINHTQTHTIKPYTGPFDFTLANLPGSLLWAAKRTRTRRAVIMQDLPVTTLEALQVTLLWSLVKVTTKLGIHICLKGLELSKALWFAVMVLSQKISVETLEAEL